MKLLGEVLWPLETAAQLVSVELLAAVLVLFGISLLSMQPTSRRKEEEEKKGERRRSEGAGDREERHNRPSPTEALDPVISELPCYES